SGAVETTFGAADDRRLARGWESSTSAGQRSGVGRARPAPGAAADCSSGRVRQGTRCDNATTGSGDVLCRVAASSHEGLQQVLLEISRSAAVVRSTSVVVLSELVPWRTLPLLRSAAAPGFGRSPNRP
ncbi:MAG: Lrp/AsnC ligand binding domain-containing protein, partial [Blastococcus sp.]